MSDNPPREVDQRPDFATASTVAERDLSAPAGADGRGLHGLVVRQIGIMVATGVLGAGQRIAIDDVCSDLGASRTVVREAVRVLEAKGMVRARPKVGTLVLPVEHWDLLDEDVIAWRVQGPGRLNQLSELMDLRVAVESAAVRACCASASDDEVSLLLDDCAQMRDAATRGDLGAFTQADIAFHARLLTASGNLIFRQFVSPFRAVLHARHELDTLPSQIDSVILDLHLDIAKAIAARQPAEAEERALTLIEASKQEVARMLTPSPLA